MKKRTSLWILMFVAMPAMAGLTVLQLNTVYAELLAAQCETLDVVGVHRLLDRLDEFWTEPADSGTQLQLLPASHFFELNHSSSSSSYGNKQINLDCVTFVSDRSGHDLTQLADQLTREGHHNRLKAMWRKLLPADLSSAEDLAGKLKAGMRPPVMFVYCVVTTNLDDEEVDVALYYPGTHFPPAYKFQDRPWFKSIAKTINRTPRQVHLSPIYHDFVTEETVLSISQLWAGQRIVADLRVSVPGSGIGVFYVNAVLAFFALVFYLKYWRLPKKRFIVCLSLSTAILLIVYIALVLAKILITDPDASAKAITYIFHAQAVLPQSALLIISARALRTRRVHRLGREIGVWFGAQLGCATLNVLWPDSNHIFGFLYGGFALCYFGQCVLANAKEHEDPALDELELHPGLAGRLCAASYFIWGACQLWIPLCRLDLLDPLSSPLNTVWPRADLLFSDPGSFVLVTLAKSGSILLTIIYLLSLERARHMKQLQTASSQYIDLSTRHEVVAHSDLPNNVSIPAGTVLTREIHDAQDQKELCYCIEKRLELQNYFCKLPRYWSDLVISVSLDWTDTSCPRIWMRVPDEAELLRHLDAAFLRATARAARQLSCASQQEFNALRERAEALSLRCTEEAERLSHRVLLDNYKITVSELWSIVIGVAGRQGIAVDSTRHPPEELKRATVRVGREVMELVAHDILSDIGESLRGTSRGITICHTALVSGTGFHGIRIELPKGVSLEERRAHSQNAASLGRPEPGFAMAHQLLEIFDGSLRVNSDSIEFGVRVMHHERRVSVNT